MIELRAPVPTSPNPVEFTLIFFEWTDVGILSSALRRNEWRWKRWNAPAGSFSGAQRWLSRACLPWYVCVQQRRCMVLRSHTRD